MDEDKGAGEDVESEGADPVEGVEGTSEVPSGKSGREFKFLGRDASNQQGYRLDEKFGLLIGGEFAGRGDFRVENRRGLFLGLEVAGQTRARLFELKIPHGFDGLVANTLVFNLLDHLFPWILFPLDSMVAFLEIF